MIPVQSVSMFSKLSCIIVVSSTVQYLICDTDQHYVPFSFQGSVAHPIVLTEAPCNPLHCRQMMSELLFECYHVPYVSYGIDSLYSFCHNNAHKSLPSPHTGIILSSGCHCSHVLPVVNGRWVVADNLFVLKALISILLYCVLMTFFERKCHIFWLF